MSPDPESTENPIAERSGEPRSESTENRIAEPSGVPTENPVVELSGVPPRSESTDEPAGGCNSRSTENPVAESSGVPRSESLGGLSALLKELEDEDGVCDASASGSSSLEVPPQDPAEKLKQMLALSRAKLQARVLSLCCMEHV